MNNHRRKQLKDISTWLENIHTSLTDIASDEQEAFDNTPEQLRKQNADEIISELDSAVSSLDDAITSIEEVLSN